MRQHIATTPEEKALSLTFSAEYHAEMNRLQESIDELSAALKLLSGSQHIELILSLKNSLSDRLVEHGDYNAALNEYVSASNLAVEHGFIDDYVLAILGMGNLCDAYGDHNRALRYYQKSTASTTLFPAARYVCATNSICWRVTCTCAVLQPPTI